MHIFNYKVEEDNTDPGIEPPSLLFPALAGGFFTTRAPGKPSNYHRKWLNMS